MRIGNFVYNVSLLCTDQWQNSIACHAFIFGFHLIASCTVVAFATSVVQAQEMPQDFARYHARFNRHFQSGRFDKALECANDCLLFARRELGEGSQMEAAALFWAADCHCELREYQTAQGLYETALKLFVAHFGNESLNVSNVLNHLGAMQGEVGDFKTGEQNLNRAVSILQNRIESGEDNLDTLADTLNSLSVLLYQSGNFRKARLTARNAIDLVEKHIGNDCEELIPLLGNAGTSSAALKNHDQAIDFLERAIRISESNGVLDSFPIAVLRVSLAASMIRQGNFDDAEAQLARSEQIFELQKRTDTQKFTTFLLIRFELRLVQGRFDEARKDLATLRALMKSLAGDSGVNKLDFMEVAILQLSSESKAALELLDRALAAMTTEADINAATIFLRDVADRYRFLKIDEFAVRVENAIPKSP
jgi:tetratricopeptide (TPR) repeat protein